MKGTKIYQKPKVTEDLESVVNYNAVWASQSIDRLRKENNKNSLALYLLGALVGAICYKLYKLESSMDRINEKRSMDVMDEKDQEVDDDILKDWE